MARVRYISSRPNKPSKPIKTKSRPGYELVRDRHTGSYVEVPVKKLGQYTVELPDPCNVKHAELLRPQSFSHGLPTPPPEKQCSTPRKRRFSSRSDTEPFCLPPPALDLNVSTIYDSPLVSKLRRACQPTPSSSPEPLLKSEANYSQRDNLGSEPSSGLETSILAASEGRFRTSGKNGVPRWDKTPAARAKEFWSKTYEPFNRGRQAHRPKFNYTSAAQQGSKCLQVKQKVDDRSSDSISHDLVCNGDVKRRRLNGERLSEGHYVEEWSIKGASLRPGEHYWPAWRKYREMEDKEYGEIFMGWKE